MQTYSPKEVSIIVGVNIIENWERVTVALDADEWTFVEGADGELTRVKNASKLGTITVIMKQSATKNLALSTLALTDGLIPITIKDGSGSSIHTIPEGTIVKRPDSEYGKEGSDREWPIKGKLSVHIVGGN